MLVTIMQGIPGSGKSTLARKLAGEYGYIVSADDYFMLNGKYIFDDSQLSDAHAMCLKNFVYFLSSGVRSLIVDNTNTRIEEVAPYYALAEAYGHEVRILRVDCQPIVASERGVHKVPINTIYDMWDRIRDTRWPSRWKIELSK